VHELYAKGGAAVDPLGKLVPGVVVDGAVDRDALRQAVFDDDTLLEKIEATVHPLLKDSRRDFFSANLSAPIVLLDIPLLFETGGDQSVHKVVVVTAPPEVQRARVLARPDMSQDRFDAILAKQLPDAEKRERADFIIDTGDGMEAARMAVSVILGILRKETA
jgi:dephospho-CoA kinase